MILPAWVDQKLSQDLSELRARGEGQEIEFKQEFPQQVSDLAKEIAAFATSNTGTILIGVKDNGDLVGLAGMEESQARDALLRRVEGICTGSIKPAVTPRAAWAIESDLIVLAITVPKGSEPLYYSQGRPYLRHITTSRPAEPHEVVDLVKRHLGSRLEAAEAEQNEESVFYSKLGSVLHRVLLWEETPMQERNINPWLEEWRADYGYAASDLRDLAATDIAIRNKLDATIREVADALNEAANFRLYLGCGEGLAAVTSHAGELAKALKRDTVDKIPLTTESISQARTIIRENSRKFSELASRAQQVVNAGKIEELQSEVGLIGQQLVLLSFYDLRELGADLSGRLREIGMNMRLIEVRRIHMDGGVSMRQVIEAVHQCAQQLGELAKAIG